MSNASSRWPKYALTDIFDIRSGLSKPASEFGSGYPFVTFKDVLDNSFLPETLGSLVRSSETERELCDVRRGDIFLTRTSETQEELGLSSVALRDYDSATFNGFTKRLRPKEPNQIVPEYAAYYFRSPRFRALMSGYSSLSTRASLNNDVLSRLQIVLPDVKTQHEIGDTLRSLDDKIEQNRRTGQALEALARATFKAWFVDFEPVKAKAAGASSFPGMPPATFAALPVCLTDSTFGPAPKGWAVQRLAEVMTLHYGKSLTKAKRQPGDIPVFGSGGVDGTHNEALVDGPGIVVGRKGSVGTIYWVDNDFFAIDTTFFVQPIGYLRLPYLYELLKTLGLEAMNTDAAVPGLNRENAYRLEVVVPPSAVVQGFDEFVGPIREMLRHLAAESSKLAALRDYLLPRLLSGQVLVAHRRLR